MARGADNECMTFVLICVVAAIVLAPLGTDSRPEWTRRTRRRAPAA